MNFQELQDRLVLRLRETIRNGELTERGLALNVGISQPHIHRVLKGAKALSLKNLDVMLMYLNRNLLDFCSETELQAQVSKLATAGKPMVDVPCFASSIGPGCSWGGDLNGQYRRPVPCELLGHCRQVAFARLDPDPAMRSSLQNCNLALLAINERSPIGSAALYAVSRGQDAVIRRIRRGERAVYLIADGLENQPLRWEAIPLGDRSSFPHIVGRVIWMGTDNARRPARSATSYRPDEATSSYAAST